MQIAASSGGSSAGAFVVLIPLLILFYLLLIRPQQKRQRQLRDLVGHLEPGDEVVTIGGIIGYVKGVEDEFIHVEVADGTVVRVVKQAIARKVGSPDLGEADGSDGDGEPAGDEPHETGGDH